MDILRQTDTNIVNTFIQRKEEYYHLSPHRWRAFNLHIEVQRPLRSNCSVVYENLLSKVVEIAFFIGLKPEKLLMDHAGPYANLKLVDFSFSIIFVRKINEAQICHCLLYPYITGHIHTLRVFRLQQHSPSRVYRYLKLGYTLSIIFGPRQRANSRSISSVHLPHFVFSHIVHDPLRTF